MPSQLDPRWPVLVGVGTAARDAEALDLMVDAVVAAADDAGSRALLGAVQRVAVPRSTWSYRDPGRAIAERIGAPGATTHLVEIGIPQQTLVNQALAAILDGTLDVAVVVGGEARRRSSAAQRAGLDVHELDQGDIAPDVFLEPSGEIMAEAEIQAGLWSPVEQYALIESALRAAEHATLDDHRTDVASLWSRMSEVAASNPEAVFPGPMAAAAIRDPSDANRPLAFPYNKWHASQWNVDQAAALILCSVEAATRLGVARERWLHPMAGLESSLSLSLSKRAAMHRWPAMQILGRAASARLGRPVSTVETAEVYSCFPAAVRAQQRELDLPLDGTPTITGGMTFAGGPFNSFVLHATAAVARRLRDEGGTGLVTTVSGLLTKPGLAVWSAESDGRAPLVGDLVTEATAETATVDVLLRYDGPARIAACTVTYDGMTPAKLVAIVDTPTGERAIAATDDAALAREATTTELIGTQVDVRDHTLHL